MTPQETEPGFNLRQIARRQSCDAQPPKLTALRHWTQVQPIPVNGRESLLYAFGNN